MTGARHGIVAEAHAPSPPGRAPDPSAVEAQAGHPPPGYKPSGARGMAQVSATYFVMNALEVKRVW
jgi:hypothetical protein